MYRLDSTVSGALATFFAIFVWTGLVVYYAFFPQLDAIAITSYRVVWSFIFVAIVITLTKQWPVIAEIVRNKRQFMLFILCGVLIGINWLAFILAIVAEKPVEASMGAYLIPMLGVGMAVFVFKEPVSLLKKAAMVLAVLGVIYMIAAYGKIPWYALSLSISFMLYGAVHKLITANVLDGFFLEMGVLIVPSVLYLTLAPNVVPFFSEPTAMKGMIMLLGPLSSLSLIAFSYGVQRIAFSTVSFIQFIYPTLTFLLGLFYFQEDLAGRLPAFIFIWTGVLVYLVDIMLRTSAFRRKISNI